MEYLKFRKKSVVFEAIQWKGTNLQEIIDFISADQKTYRGGFSYDSQKGLTINTSEGFLNVSVNDWIIRGVKEEFYLREPDSFEATYESVNDDIIGTSDE